MPQARATSARRRFAIALGVLLGCGAAGCAGGAPLLHPAKTMNLGEVRVAAGLSGNVALGSAADDLRTAREVAAKDPNAPGPPGTNPDYAKGALVAAAVAPGVAPFVAARVGIGSRFEGGITYTGRAVRIDARRSFDFGPWSLSLGLGGTGALYARQQGTPLPAVDLAELRGYGADVPILIGAQTDDGMLAFWFGARGGWEHDRIETLTSEPKSVTIGIPPTSLTVRRFYAGGLLGATAGIKHVHVAFELSGAYEDLDGAFNATQVSVHGVSLSPATALWWSF
jgi:hypothetical protein